MTALVAQRGAIGLGQEASALPASGERFAARLSGLRGVVRAV